MLEATDLAEFTDSNFRYVARTLAEVYCAFGDYEKAIELLETTAVVADEPEER